MFEFLGNYLPETAALLTGVGLSRFIVVVIALEKVWTGLSWLFKTIGRSLKFVRSVYVKRKFSKILTKDE